MHSPLTYKVQALPYKNNDVIELYTRYADRHDSFIFEYNNADNKSMPPRFSVIGLSILARITVKKNRLCLSMQDTEQTQQFDDPKVVWAALESMLSDFSVPDIAQIPCFSGGWFGCFGYESVRYFEPNKLPDPQLQDLTGSQDITMLLPKQLLVLDHHTQRMWSVAYAFDDDVPSLTLIESDHTWAKDTVLGPVKYQFKKPEFIDAVGKLKQHIKDGEIMQAVLSQRMCVDVIGSGIEFFSRLRNMSPSPYQFYVRTDASCLFGASPETLIRSEKGALISFPMAGTRHRSACEKENQQREVELLNDTKECAEHLMLIDLARNDLGKVAKLSSVSVPKMMSVEHFSHVMHITSEVRAEQLQHISPLGLIRATLPAGTLSGAPKIRAMQLIDQYEPVRRGLYGGGVGVISGGDVDLAIVIRTALIKDGCLHLQAGAGVVSDSIAQSEWQETLNKSKALLLALGITDSSHNMEMTACC
ncbi:anthranilate synthase component I [Pseudoalteromonas citrea]|uniref:anthranilate synthase n=1 Tax=Pseudoalteromonas citrea TaxID=43655 RepID=A0A5S3XQ07_9GAMM|nr:anthranilate synthase component I family protein [Pseudoalteromonas citrea]TMP43995.1 anthranilate synthase component I [Pseudoalteromonas citrea]TMP59433.1 anthranilate synthase component I [Pseudoalteromonas citrea]